MSDSTGRRNRESLVEIMKGTGADQPLTSREQAQAFIRGHDVSGGNLEPLITSLEMMFRELNQAKRDREDLTYRLTSYIGDDLRGEIEASIKGSKFWILDPVVDGDHENDYIRVSNVRGDRLVVTFVGLEIA